MNRDKIKKILILREDAVGDMVLAIPAINAIYKKLDHPSITILASNYSRNDELIRHISFIDEVMISPNIQTMSDIWKFSKLLKSKEFDLSIHLSTRAGTAWACHFSIPHNIGDKAILGLLPVFFKLGRFYPPHHMMSHQVQRNFFLLKPLGIEESDANSASLYLPPHPDDRTTIQILLDNAKFDPSRPSIVIHLGASGGKPVLPEKYVAYASQMHAIRPDIQFILTGASPEEKEFRDRFLSLINFPVIDLVSQTSIREMITLLTHISLIIGVDTGPAHIAAAVKTPQLLMSTAKRIMPFKWGPWLNRHLIVRQNDRCELTCHARECPYWTCSDDLPVSKMVDLSIELLNGGGVSTFNDQQREWFKLLPIALIVDPSTRSIGEAYQKILTQWGCKVVVLELTNPELYQQCVARDIRIIHNISKRKRIKLFIMAQLLNRELSHPPLLCHGSPTDRSFDETISYYRHQFSRRIL